MLSFLPGPLLFVINFILIVINTVIIATPILILALLRVLLPFAPIIKIIERLNLFLYGIWVQNNSLTIALTNKIDWQINSEQLNKIKNSCIIICNHQSWADIVMICHIFRGKIPITKFFLKHSLIYIPLIGLACLGLGMPFLRRYSKQQLLKNPKLKTKDIESTNKACRRLIHAPSTLVNFVEGILIQKSLNSFNGVEPASFVLFFDTGLVNALFGLADVLLCFLKHSTSIHLKKTYVKFSSYKILKTVAVKRFFQYFKL